MFGSTSPTWFPTHPCLLKLICCRRPEWSFLGRCCKTVDSCAAQLTPVQSGVWLWQHVTRSRILYLSTKWRQPHPVGVVAQVVPRLEPASVHQGQQLTDNNNKDDCSLWILYLNMWLAVKRIFTNFDTLHSLFASVFVPLCLSAALPLRGVS